MPSAQEFNATVHEAGHRAIVSVVGEVDLYTGPRLWSVLEEAIAAGHRTVELDSTGVSFMDSTGISVIVRARNALERQGGALLLGPMSSPVQKVLEITGLLQHLPAADSDAGQG